MPLIETQRAILIGVGVYIVLTLVIGLYASRGTKSATDFILAGRRLPLWLCSTSIFATWFGSGIMMGAATSGYDRDFVMMMGEPYGSALALLLAGLFFARIMRRTRRLTWVEFFEVRYGRIAGIFGAAADILSGIIWVGGLLFTFGLLIEALTGVSLVTGIVVGLVVVVTYTVIGGMWAVAMTDFVQMLVLVIGLVILGVVVLDDVGGWSAIAARLPEHTLRFAPVEHTYKNWIEYIHVFMNLGVAGLASNSIILRGLAARNETVAQQSFLVATIGYVTIGSIPLMLGLVASVTMPGLENSNSVLTELALAHLHPALVVVFVGAIVSAIMSSCDSVLLSAGSIVSTNLLPIVKPEASDRLRLAVARWTIPIAAAAATWVAFGAEKVVSVLIDSAAPLLAMTIVPFIACFYWNKANSYGALAGIIGGLLGWGAASAAGTVTPPDLIGFVVSAAFMVAVTLISQRACPPKPLTDIDGDTIPLRDHIKGS